VFGDDVAGFRSQVRAVATKLARHQDWHAWMDEKRRRRAADERVKPLEAYRGEEMARSHECFFGADRSYHEARMRFVYKLGAPCVVAPVTPQPDAGKTFVVNVAPEPVAAVAPEPVAAVAPEPVAAVAPEPVAPVAPEPVAAVAPEPVAAVAPATVEVETVKPEPFVPALSAQPDPGVGGPVSSFVLDTTSEASAPPEAPAEVGWRLVSNS